MVLKEEKICYKMVYITLAFRLNHSWQSRLESGRNFLNGARHLKS